MIRELTEHQKRCSDLIVARMQEYLDLRFTMACRANPRFETAWPDLQWLLLQQLRNVIENDKMWGPKRFVISELLCGHDKAKIQDIFNPSNQASIQTEIVEKKEQGGHKTADVLEIHDFRTLYAAIDPGIAQITAVMQVYMWWDLRDAVDLSKFEIKLGQIKELQNGVSDHQIKEYVGLMGKVDGDHPPTPEEIVDWECEELRNAVDQFLARRNGEPGYKIILAQRNSKETENQIDILISTIAREQVLKSRIKSGQSIDDSIRQQLAKALRVQPTELTAEMELKYLGTVIAEHKSKLRQALLHGESGEQYNFKLDQASAMYQQYEEFIKGIYGEEALAAQQS